jgi:hypothetical protein
MVTDTRDSGDRLPTTGPETDRYDRYRIETTATGETLIYDVENEDAWIEGDSVVSLDDWQ